MWALRFLLDTSGSTGTVQDNGMRLLDNVFDAAVDQVVSEVAATAAAEGVALAVEFDGFSTEITKDIVPSLTIASGADVSAAMRAAKEKIRDVPCHGMTHLRDSICKSLAELTEYGAARGVLLVVTDGADTGSSANDETVARCSLLAREANIVFVPVVCADVSDNTKAHLQRAAGLGVIPAFGRTHSVETAEAMRDVSQTVCESISGAYVVVPPLLRPPILQIPTLDDPWGSLGKPAIQRQSSISHDSKYHVSEAPPFFPGVGE